MSEGDEHVVTLRGQYLTAYRDSQRLKGELLAASETAWHDTQQAAIQLDRMLPTIDPATWQGAALPGREWTWADWIPARQATYLTGAGSAGKSLLTQQLATRIALGQPFLGVETRQAVSIYLTCEDDADELHRRQAAICDACDTPLASLSGLLHLVSLAGAIGNELATFDSMGRMAPSPAWDRLLATVRGRGARFVVLDNVAHLFAGNENIRNQVAAFCGLLNSLAAETGASVLLIGHPNKAGDAFSGSTAWENQVRSRLFLDRPRDTDGSILDPDARTLSRDKANYARNGETLAFRWHRWAFVEEGDLPPDTARQIAATMRASADNALFLTCLAKATSDRRAVSHVNGTNYAPAIFAKMPEAKGAKALVFAAAMERLLHIGSIRLDQPLWKDAHRKWKQGIKLASECGDPPAPTPCGDLRQPTPQVFENAAATMRAATPLYTTYRDGGASEGPPPSYPPIEGEPA